MMLRLILAATTALTLLGCSSDNRRYALEATPVASKVHVRARVPSVLVRSVSLPTYAAAEEIAYQDKDGIIRISKADFWADEPERATTLVIARHLTKMTSATVAPEPWPMEELPKATVDIRVEQLLATNHYSLRLTGQFFIAGQEIVHTDLDTEPPKVPRRTISSRAKLFDIEVPLLSETPGGLAVAQSDALRLLSEKIAKELAR